MSDCVCDKIITKVLSDVKTTSEEVKSYEFSEAKINSFLDSIIEFKRFITDRTNSLTIISTELEKLSWVTIDTKERQQLIKVLIVACTQLHRLLIAKYIKYNKLRVKGIAVNEIIEFKRSIDDFKETYKDVEFVFFELPQDEKIKEVTKKIEFLNENFQFPRFL